jgi:hypothetical protein
MTQDESGNYYVLTNGKPYRVLLASVTYFKALPGDEIAVVLPRDIESNWAAIENVIQRGAHKDWQSDLRKATEANEAMNSWKADLKESSSGEENTSSSEPEDGPIDPAVLDSWVRDMEEIEKEIRATETDAASTTNKE